MDYYDTRHPATQNSLGLIVNQANKEWSCLDDKMMMYCEGLRNLENNFDGIEYLHIL
jgi:hypothetical protein